MAEIIYPNGSSVYIEPRNGKHFKLEEIQEIVGGYVQAITLYSGDLLLMDEDGKDKDYPRNDRATVMLAGAGIPDDTVVGTVLVCSRKQF